MSITIADFGEDFVNKFSQEYQNYIINFCNSFQKIYPGILDKETLIERISTIESIKEVPKLRHGEGGRTEYCNGTNNIKFIEGLSENDKKNILYHELLHVLSRHSIETRNDAAGLTIEGVREYEADVDDFYFENPMLDEIMNEYYTVKLLEAEGYIDEKAYTLTAQNYKLNQFKDIFRHFGNGYIDRVQLAEILDNMFGEDLLKAKLLGGKEFREMFNQKYKDIDIPIPEGEDIPPAQEITPYERFQFQIGLGSIYKSFETAIDLWKKNNDLTNEQFNLYDYLKKTNNLMSFLPVREDTGAYRTDKGNKGIPPNLFSKITQMDKEIISQYIRPDLMNLQNADKKTTEINNVLAIICILRENINELTPQDIESLSYGKVEEYTHGGKDCLVINTDSEIYMTFVNNSIESNQQFNAYSKFKKISEFKDLQFTEESEAEVKKTLRENGYDVQDFTYATVYDAGEYGMWSLVKSNNSYYKTTGEISEVQLSGVQTLGRIRKFHESTLSSDLYELSSQATISDFNEMSQNIRASERINEQAQILEDERT